MQNLEHCTTIAKTYQDELGLELDVVQETMRDADVIGDAESLGKNALELTLMKPMLEIEDSRKNLVAKNRQLLEIVTALKSTQAKIVHS